jgi:hypothetical protein
MLVKVLFLVGVLLALLMRFWGGYDGVFPWLLGGLGIVTGIVAWWERTPWILIASIALIVALTAIHQQPFNPTWLTSAVFFIRVFVAHVALAAGLLAVFAPRHPELEP